MTEGKNKEVFIISQIGDEDTAIRQRADEIADHIVKPVAAEFDLEIERSDRDPTPGPISTRLLTSILQATAVVVDATGRNPNVFYELAFAQCFGVPVVVMVDKPASLPFDTKDERVIVLGDNGSTIGVTQAEKAKARLRDTLQLVVDEKYQPRSLISQVAGLQRIENLGPADPMVAELQALQQNLGGRIDELSEKLDRPRTRSPLPYTVADLNQLMNFVGEQAAAGTFAPRYLEEMKSMKTTHEFDEWIDRISGVASRKRQNSTTDINEEDFDDIPF